VAVPDPYRWLENAGSDETRSFIDAENQLTRRFLDQLPERESIRKRLRQLWDYERFDLPTERGGRFSIRTTRGF
jgi:prolyl oligopeptidase